MKSVRSILFASAVAVSTIAIAAPPADKTDAKAPTDIATATRGAERVAGFFDVYRDTAKGRVLLGMRELDTPFLLITSLPWGLGSNDVGLDRGQSGESHLVEFRRAGSRLLLVEDNTKFRASSSNADEARSVREAFVGSVTCALPLVSRSTSQVSIVPKRARPAAAPLRASGTFFRIHSTFVAEK
jgi:hypothetical protein